MIGGGYSVPAPAKYGVGIGTPPINIAHNRASGFFMRKASSHLFNGEACRAAVRLAGFYVDR